MRHAEEFMWKGMKVKLQIKFRGPRDDAPGHRHEPSSGAWRVDLSQIGVADTEPKLIGKSINYDAITTARSEKGSANSPTRMSRRRRRSRRIHFA